MDKAQIHSRLNSLSFKAFLFILGFWPVCAWYIQRTFDRSDEPWGVLALLCAIYYASKAGVKVSGAQHHLLACVLIVLYMASFTLAPHMVQGLLMVGVLWCWFFAGVTVPWRWGVLGLLLLSLPIVPSINFFAGYPLRLIVSRIAQLILACFGIHAAQEGTLLLVDGRPISIDAPCSGISMLWVQCFFTMLLACYFKVAGARRTAILTAASVVLVLFANSVRAVALILFDCFCQSPGIGAQMIAHESVVHVWAGLLALMLALSGTAILAKKLSVSESSKNENSTNSSVLAAKMARSLRTDDKSIISGGYRSIALLCACAALLPFFASSTVSHNLVLAEPEWPAVILGHKVTAVPSLSEERAFAADFPGQMRRFTDGTNNYFVRVVNKETRQLHPSSDCFKGMGYSIEPQPLFRALDGSMWGSFYATKGSSRYLILEQLHDEQGHTWSDVSAWYWHALTHGSAGPWWDITVATPIMQSN